MPSLPASKFGQSAVIGRGSHCGLFPLRSARLGLQLSCGCCTRRSAESVVARQGEGEKKKKKKKRAYTGMEALASRIRSLGRAGEQVWSSRGTFFRVSERRLNKTETDGDREGETCSCFYALATQHARVGLETVTPCRSATRTLRAGRDIYNRNSIPFEKNSIRGGGGGVKDNTGMKWSSGFPACCGVVTDGWMWSSVGYIQRQVQTASGERWQRHGAALHRQPHRANCLQTEKKIYIYI